MKLQPTQKRLLGGALLTTALAYVCYGVVEPKSPAGHAVFHVGYSLAVSRPIFLRLYQWSLREFDGGSLPASIDEFLVMRLWSPCGRRERRAIIDFQITQTSGRWGDGLSHVHDNLKKQIIGDIFHRLDTFPSRKAVEALVFVESLRRGDPLRKGGFAPRDLWTINGNTYTLRTNRLVVTKDSFRRWWSDGSTWPGNKSQDPLHGTGITIEDGP